MKKQQIVIIMLVFILSLCFVGCSKKDVVIDDVTDKILPETTKEIVEDKEEDREATVDTMTTPSIVDNGEALKKALSADGSWIAATLNDIVLTDDLIVEGEFKNKDVKARKIALYTQDTEHNIIDSFSLTAPKLIIRSENTKLQGGTFIGDVYVEADGFTISEATVRGNIFYSLQSYMDSAIMDGTGKVTGTKEIKQKE
mgnify:CR=1 FL=1